MGDLSISTVNRKCLVESFSVIQTLLFLHVLTLDTTNVVKWCFENSKEFSIGVCYSTLRDNINISPSVFSVAKSSAFILLWATTIPMKRNVFGWRVLLDRLANKDHLDRRGILSSSHDLPCAFCLCEDENLQHLFFKCGVEKQVWVVVPKWVGIDVVYEEGILDCFMGACSILVRKVRKNRAGLFCRDVLWGIWTHRNTILFYDHICNVNNFVWSIMYLSWKCSMIGDMPNSNINFYDFCVALLYCLSYFLVGLAYLLL